MRALNFNQVIDKASNGIIILGYDTDVINASVKMIIPEIIASNAVRTLFWKTKLKLLILLVILKLLFLLSQKVPCKLCRYRYS